MFVGLLSSFLRRAQSRWLEKPKIIITLQYCITIITTANNVYYFSLGETSLVLFSFIIIIIPQRYFLLFLSYFGRGSAGARTYPALHFSTFICVDTYFSTRQLPSSSDHQDIVIPSRSRSSPSPHSVWLLLRRWSNRLTLRVPHYIFL